MRELPIDLYIRIIHYELRYLNVLRIILLVFVEMDHYESESVVKAIPNLVPFEVRTSFSKIFRAIPTIDGSIRSKWDMYIIRIVLKESQVNEI